MDIGSNKENRFKVEDIPVSFGSRGVKLSGKLLLPREMPGEGSVPAAVLCHGFGSDHRAFESSARNLASWGVASFIFDFRGHGSSEGAANGRMVDDVVDAWRSVGGFSRIDRKRMCLVGHSIGAVYAIKAAEEVTDPPKALVALSCPPEVSINLLTDELVIGNWRINGKVKKAMASDSEIEHPKQGHFPWVGGPSGFFSRMWMHVAGYKIRINWQEFLEALPTMRTSDVLQKLNTCDKLFALCDGDRLNPYREAVRLYERASEPKKLLLAQKGSHTTPLLPGSLRTEWIRWVVGALKA